MEEVPQVAAQYGVEADGGFVEDQQVGGAEEGDGEGDAAALAAGEVSGEGVGAGGEVDVGDGAGDGFGAAVGGGAAGVEDGGEVVEVLPDGEVVVDGGGLGDVADAGAELGVVEAGRPRTSRVPVTWDWLPTTARMRVDLPQPEGPRRPVMRPRGTSKAMESMTVRGVRPVPRRTVRSWACTAAGPGDGGPSAWLFIM